MCSFCTPSHFPLYMECKIGAKTWGKAFAYRDCTLSVVMCYDMQVFVYELRSIAFPLQMAFRSWNWIPPTFALTEFDIYMIIRYNQMPLDCYQNRHSLLRGIECARAKMSLRIRNKNHTYNTIRLQFVAYRYRHVRNVIGPDEYNVRSHNSFQLFIQLHT